MAGCAIARRTPPAGPSELRYSTTSILDRSLATSSAVSPPLAGRFASAALSTSRRTTAGSPQNAAWWITPNRRPSGRTLTQPGLASMSANISSHIVHFASSQMSSAFSTRSLSSALMKAARQGTTGAASSAGRLVQCLGMPFRHSLLCGTCSPRGTPMVCLSAQSANSAKETMPFSSWSMDFSSFATTATSMPRNCAMRSTPCSLVTLK
mmetsp:Transcript_51243/g.132200  ORF Transcript_51243/g.132200 Transcript_51243/m.132200 type:complete len:209 (-) Transcript_51243:257-883(-)